MTTSGLALGRGFAGSIWTASRVVLRAAGERTWKSTTSSPTTKSPSLNWTRTTSSRCVRLPATSSLVT